MLLWRSALGAELARQTWDLPELGLIAAVCTRPVLADALGVPVGLVAQEVIDATAATPGLLGEAWGVDEQQLIGRLAQLGPTADLALYDAVSRWWATGAAHDIEGWASVGLRTR